MVRWGIIGVGQMANIFAQAIQEIENANLIAVSSKNSKNLETFGEQFKIDQRLRFNSYEEICENKQIDAIYISTLNNSHFNLIKLS